MGEGVQRTKPLKINVNAFFVQPENEISSNASGNFTHKYFAPEIKHQCACIWIEFRIDAGCGQDLKIRTSRSQNSPPQSVSGGRDFVHKMQYP